MTPEEKKRDKYYVNKYGITLAEYNCMVAICENKCGICQRLPKTIRHNVDHDHTVSKVKIVCDKKCGIWWAEAAYRGNCFNAHGPNKSGAIQYLRRQLKRASIRGLLCAGRHFGCNRKLGRVDNIEWLENAVKYLKKENTCIKY